jgi:ankyrin repeat protein
MTCSALLYINAKDYENRTALYYAANRGASDLVACLVAIPGIELDTVATTSGWTPLATTRRPDVIEILLATRKVNPWRRDRHGQRAIDSFTNKPHLEAFKLLQAYMKSSDIIERFAVDAVADSPPIKIS